MEKLNEYEGFSGRLHHWRESFKELILTQRERDSTSIFEVFKNAVSKNLSGNISATQDFSHIYRHKTRMEFVRISAAVMGIEFSYAAETAFVSPTLLKIGSMSDRCNLNMGRRRPFIILLSIGVIFGLLLIPNGEQLGYWFGDDYQELHSSIIEVTNTSLNMVSHRVTASQNEKHSIPQNKHPWGIFFTVLGTVLLDFDADACQSPARAYLLDICLPEDHVKGLSTFTIMAGLGGFMGYSMGAVDWDTTIIGQKLGGHIKTVFTLVTFIFIFCVTLTITSFKEIPLWVIADYTNDRHQRVDTSNDDMEAYSAVNQLTCNDEKVSVVEKVMPSGKHSIHLQAFHAELL
ncbi:PREDICTED: proton-associated sugar transporter A-like [Bactrocera latifrons]|uniref:proton-associated sugar transporter A-like n=1 Tax=Bactrocera latifrons TaxID=174628 RepID=UPI0008DE92FC|nr:PREDICTED: proton-associated sugar transporter A-like [Bactrocera latifrons]